MAFTLVATVFYVYYVGFSKNDLYVRIEEIVGHKVFVKSFMFSFISVLVYYLLFYNNLLII